MDRITLPLDSSVQNIHVRESARFLSSFPQASDRSHLIGEDIMITYNRGAVRNPGDVVIDAQAWIGNLGWRPVNDNGFFQLYGWIDMSMGKFASMGSNVIIAFRNYQSPDQFAGDEPTVGVVHFEVIFYSSVNRYTIKGHIGPDDEGYMAGYVSNRSPRAGEDWCRGGDLMDGEFSWNTWNSILMDILSSELVDVNQKNVRWALKPDDGPNETTEGHPRCVIRKEDNTYTGSTRPFRG